MGSKSTRYDEEFIKSLVDLYHNGKTQVSICQEYGVSQTTLTRWIKQYSSGETEDGDVLTAKQIKEMPKRMVQLEEENLILKKRLPSSRFTQGTNRCSS